MATAQRLWIQPRLRSTPFLSFSGCGVCSTLLGAHLGSTSDLPYPAPPAHRNEQKSEAQIRAYLTDVPGRSHAPT